MSDSSHRGRVFFLINNASIIDQPSSGSIVRNFTYTVGMGDNNYYDYVFLYHTLFSAYPDNYVLEIQKALVNILIDPETTPFQLNAPVASFTQNTENTQLIYRRSGLTAEDQEVLHTLILAAATQNDISYKGFIPYIATPLLN